MRKSIANGCTCVLLTAAVTLMPATPSFAACQSGQFRAGDWAESYGDDGVAGRFQIPSPSDVSGFSSTNGHQSVGDLYLYDSGGASFVQLGWYVGAADQLPYATVPTIFIGEYHVGSLNDEVLRTFSTLGWASSHYFKIVSIGAGYFTAEVSGRTITSTLYAHSAVNDAATNGEVDYNGVSMWANARADSSPYATLQFRGAAGGIWHWFADHDYSSAGFGSYQVGGTSTDLAYGGGVC